MQRLLVSLLLLRASFALPPEACSEAGSAACGAAKALAPELLAEDKSGSSHLIQLQAGHRLSNKSGSFIAKKGTVAELLLSRNDSLAAAPAGNSSGGGNNNTNPKKVTEAKYRLAGDAPSKARAAKLLEQRGRFLGFSRDCWLLLAICVAGNLFCIIITFVNVSIGIGIRASEHCTGEIPKNARGHIKQPVFRVGFLQRNVLRADLNPAFAYKADMALRTAFACAGCALPYYCEGLEWLLNYGFSFNYAVVIICFTVYSDIGTTLSLSWFNFAGTLLPCLNCLFAYGMYPHGATELYSDSWWFGIGDFVLFIALQMCLSWPTGVRMFAVSWQAYFSMCFINPNDTTHFSSGIQDIILEGAAVSPLIGTVIGCTIAVLVMCSSPLGYCFSALTSAQELALTLAWEESRQWRRMIYYYSSSNSSVAIDKIVGEAHKMYDDVKMLEGYLGTNSWWECFDIGRAGKVRAHLQQLDGIMRRMHDWLRGTLQAMREEDFGDEHDAMLEMIKGQLMALSDASSELLFRGVRSACKGGVDPEERDAMQQDIDKVLKAQEELATGFSDAKKKVYGTEDVTKDAISEHFFVFALSTYGQYASDFAESMMNNEIHTPEIGLFMAFGMGILNTFKPMSAAYAVRSSMGFFLAFAVGWNGITGMLAPFNSTPAGTTAYLMASEGKGGSAILKNIARFQGTAGGTLLGQLIFCSMISCSWRGSVMGLIAVTVLEFMSMYLYFASSAFGYVGVLLGAYGAQHLLIFCDQGESYEAVYGVMLQQFLAILAVTLADLCIGNVSSATLAVQAYCRMSDTIGQSLKEFLCLHLDGAERKEIPEPKSRRKEVLMHYGEVSAQGAEAPLEPRWYRTPWRDGLWHKMEKFTSAIGDKMAVMEYAALEGHLGGGARAALVHSETMRETSEALFHRAQSVFLLCEKLMMHENNAPFDLPKALLRGLLRQKEMNITHRLDDILAEVNAALKVSDQKKEKVKKLTHDDSCQVGACLSMLSFTMKNVNKIEDAIFTTRELSLNHAH